MRLGKYSVYKGYIGAIVLPLLLFYRQHPKPFLDVLAFTGMWLPQYCALRVVNLNAALF